jgi:hypothetical protein
MYRNIAAIALQIGVQFDVIDFPGLPTITALKRKRPSMSVSGTEYGQQRCASEDDSGAGIGNLAAQLWLHAGFVCKHSL